MEEGRPQTKTRRFLHLETKERATLSDEEAVYGTKGNVDSNPLLPLFRDYSHQWCIKPPLTSNPSQNICSHWLQVKHAALKLYILSMAWDTALYTGTVKAD